MDASLRDQFGKLARTAGTREWLRDTQQGCCQLRRDAPTCFDFEKGNLRVALSFYGVR